MTETENLIAKTSKLDIPDWYCQMVVDVFGRNSELKKEKLEDRIRESAELREVFNIQAPLKFLEGDIYQKDGPLEPLQIDTDVHDAYLFGQVVEMYLTEVNDSNLFEHYVTCQLLFLQNTKRIRTPAKGKMDEDRETKVCQLKSMLNTENDKLLAQMEMLMTKLSKGNKTISELIERKTRIDPQSYVKNLQDK